MKKSYYFSALSAALFALSLNQLQAGNGERDENPSKNLTIKFYNEDIGPVRGGRFLDDQKFFAEGNVTGKNPGSGLFLIPNGNNHESPAYPLFNLVPFAKIVTKNGTVIESPTKDEQLNFYWAKDKTHRLGLPGETTEITYPVSTDDVLCVSVCLQAYDYGFTTGGGSVWMTHAYVRDPLTHLITSFGDKGAFSEPLDVIFSWPKSRPAPGITNPDAKLNVEFKYLYSVITREDLVPNWKQEIGLNTDRAQIAEEKSKNQYNCWSTRDLNRGLQGLDPAEDCHGLGDDFPYYGGHPVDHSLYIAYPFQK
jgi:hypothetical protein